MGLTPEQAARRDRLAEVLHPLFCSRCKMGWWCGGVDEDDYEQADTVRPFVEQEIAEAEAEAVRRALDAAAEDYRRSRAEAMTKVETVARALEFDGLPVTAHRLRVALAESEER